jgi:hypothetical protein
MLPGGYVLYKDMMVVYLRFISSKNKISVVLFDMA